jgi:hypothetical protein
MGVCTDDGQTIKKELEDKISLKEDELENLKNNLNTMDKIVETNEVTPSFFEVEQKVEESAPIEAVEAQEAVIEPVADVPQDEAVEVKTE